MRRGAHRERQPRVDRDSHFESEQLEGDLTLVVVHTHGAVVLTIANFEIQGV